MNTERATHGRQVLGAGVMALGIVCLVQGDFDPGQPVAAHFPGRTFLAYVAATFMLLAGAAMTGRRTAAWGAAALSTYFGIVVVLLMGGPVVLAHYQEFGSYSGVAEQLALAAAALIVYATARTEPALPRRLTRAGQLCFGICALLFGGAHFFYLNLTAPLVPGWLPPGQLFWAYATGAAQIAAGLAILTGKHSRLAAVLLTAMYGAFTLLVHLPMLIADPHNGYTWNENALNLALIGAAWVVADSLKAHDRAGRPADFATQS